MANLYFGLELFAGFAVDIAAIGAGRARRLLTDGWDALGEAALAQRGIQADSDPARRFLDLLTAALTAGKAYVAGAVHLFADGDEDYRPMFDGSAVRVGGCARSDGELALQLFEQAMLTYERVYDKAQGQLTAA